MSRTAHAQHSHRQVGVTVGTGRRRAAEDIRHAGIRARPSKSFFARLIRDILHEELRAPASRTLLIQAAPDPSCLRDGPVTTAPQAALYCGFKTTAAIEEGVRRRDDSVPLGKRGGRARTSGLAERSTRSWSARAVVSFRPDVQVRLRRDAGGHHGRNKMGREMEVLRRAEALTTGGVAPERRWFSRSGSGPRTFGRESSARPEVLRSGEGHGRGRGLPVPAGRARREPQRSDGSASDRALQRIRGNRSSKERC